MTISNKKRSNAFMEMRRNYKSRNIRRNYIRELKTRIEKLWNKIDSGNIDDNVTLRRHPVESLIWWFVHITAVIISILGMINITIDFQRNPTVTAAETNRYPVQSVGYPAISICNINRISYKAAVDLAEELLEFDSTTYNVNLTVEELTDMLSLMGNLYRFNINEKDADRVKLLHAILERGYNGYDVPRIMNRLTPKCRTMLQQCSWRGKDLVCDDLFFVRKTENGFCCTFNYVRRLDIAGSGEFVLQNVEHSFNIGPDYGLSVFLDPQLDDYMYKFMPSTGFRVSIFSPFDYPDGPSGKLRQILIPPRTENFLNLDAVTFYTTEDAKKYSATERDCLFHTEQSKIFHGYYSFSDCIMHCRTRDILELCRCVPFFYPLEGDTASARTCNLKDLPCLRRYRERWWNLKPRFERPMVPFDPEKVTGKDGYLSCDCFPSCEDIDYSVFTDSIELNAPTLIWDRSNFIVQNHSVIHIFFGKSGTLRLKQDVVFYWYELLSNYGGICNLFLGLSILNFVEMLYKFVLCCCKSAEPPKSPVKVVTITESSGTRKKSVEEIESDIQTIYWNEIVNQSKQEKFKI